MKRRILAGLLLAGMLLFAACGTGPQGGGAAGAPDSAGEESGQTEQPQEPDDEPNQTEEPDQNGEDEEEPDMSDAAQNPMVEIEIQDYGTVTVRLDAQAAPATVENFVKLVEDGFYDGLTFHRIISGFMIQGGDPKGNGTGGSDQQIKGEFSSNGVDNPLSHTRGAISMARSQLPDSASSQFFIVHEDSLFLDGNYAVFGYVTDGIEVVDAICDATTVQDSNGTVLSADQPVITAVRIVE